MTFCTTFQRTGTGKVQYLAWLSPFLPGYICIHQQIPKVLFPGKRFAESSRRPLAQERRKRLC